MVYRGKASKACEWCRKRRIKCDQKEPSCTQCLKKSILCEGYRDPLDLAFQDETTSVVQRFHSRQKHNTPQMEQMRPRELMHSRHMCPVVGMPQSLNQPVHDVAVNHFLQSYTPGSHFDYLGDIFNKVSPASPLFSATCAAALMNLSRERQEPDIMVVARKFYSQALERTNATLMSMNALLDGTLISVLLLSLFETIVLRDQISGEGWTTHTEGAFALLKLRGSGQFDTDLGRKLYVHISSRIRISCAQRAVPLPTALVKLDALAAPFMDCTGHALQFCPIIDSFIRLQIVDKNRHLGVPSERLELALNIENMASQLSLNRREAWRYDILATQDAPVEAFRGRAHRYENQLIARQWNSIRMVRIFVNEVICDYADIMLENQDSADRESWSSMRTVAAQVAKDMGEDILATIPQFIRTPVCENPQPLNMPTAAGFIWPVSAVSRSVLSPTDAKRYATETLYIIGKEARLPQATKIAEMMEAGKLPLQWLHMFHLV